MEALSASDKNLEFSGNKLIARTYADFIDPSLLSASRLDCDYYGPTFVANQARLESAPCALIKLRDLSTHASDGTHDTIEMLGGYQQQGIRFITSAEVVAGLAASPLFITEQAHRRNKRSEVLQGDLLVAVRGSTGVGTARVYRHDAPANINTAVARIRVTPPIDPYWVATFFNSAVGRLSTLRIANGVNQLNLNMEETGDLEVPIPTEPIQRAIGNKLRKAERLREAAVAAQQSVSNLIDRWYAVDEWSDRHPYGWLSPKNFGPDRADAWFNQPSYIRLARSLAGRGNLKAVGSIAALATEPVDFDQFAGSYFEYFEIADIDSGSGIITSDRVATNSAPSRAKYLVHAGDLLISTVRPNRKGMALVPDSVSSAVCSSGFSVIRAPDLPTAHYLRACLLHDVATHQMMRWNSGATYPAIDRSVPLSVLIPYPGHDEIERHGLILHSAAKDLVAAQELIASAQSDVDRLVDGTLDEQSLITESEQIEFWLRHHHSSPERSS